MSWWNPTRLVGLRERLIVRQRRWLLPYWAVFEADLGSLVRSWVLRAWLVLTALFALVTLLDHSDPPAVAGGRAQGTVLAAILHPVDTTPGPVHVVRELLKSYVVVWVTFVIMLTGGTISSEMGVMADSILSRGISRWQYFLGKWTSRLVAVLGVYTLVMVPTTLVVWFGIDSSGPEADSVTLASVETGDHAPGPAPLPKPGSLCLRGACVGLARVGSLLALVVTCGVAFSASFSSTMISTAVGWVTIYGTGLVLSMLRLKFLSPARLIEDLHEILRGRYIAADQCWLLGASLLMTLLISLISGSFFARRDV